MKKREKHEKNTETVSTLVYAYLFILFAGLPLYMQNKLVLIGNAKYLFFRNTTLVLGTFIVLAALWQRIRGEKKQKEKRQGRSSSDPWRITDAFLLLYLISAIVAYGVSPCKEDAFLGYPGWYMGLLTQALLVGIYFAVSRYYDDSKSIWWIAGITAGIVTLIGLLNRLDIDVLGTFRGMENGEWNRTQLLSTIGNNNWYAGYISVTAGISLAAAFMGERYVRALGMLGSFLFFASAITSNSTTAILAACGLSLLLLLLSLQQRRRLLRALEILMLLPLSVFMVRIFIRFHLTGLVLAGDAEKALFFTPVWYGMFAVEAAGYLILKLRERRKRADRLESGRIFRIAVGMTAAVALVMVILGGLLVAGIFSGGEKLSEIANGRLALWKVTLLTYGKEGVLFKGFGMGPDSFYYALYQWGSDAMDWINRGLLDNNVYSNAHNEWLTLLIQQGILGVIAYGGIFATSIKNLRRSVGKDPRALAVFLGLTGYLICSLFTFQHVLSTPFAFALLGMARGVFLERNITLYHGRTDSHTIIGKVRETV